MTLIVTLSGTHLAEPNAARALCGESVARPIGTFEPEPGQDFGAAPTDCKRCAWRLAGKP